MNYKISLLVVLYLFFGSNSYGAPAEAEFRKLKENWTLREDGSQEYRCYKELTLFTHTAMNSTYGETFITYNPEFQQLKIHASYTKQKDGTIIHTPANAFVEVLPRHAEKAPAYNHLKEMVIVHTGLELGATVYLDYSILSNPGYLPEISICRELQQSSPVKEYTLSIQVPATKDIHYSTFAFTQRPVEVIKEQQRVCSWNFKGLPARSREPEVSLQNGDLPGITISTYPTYQQALRSLYRQFDTEPAPEVIKLAETLTQGCSSATQKLEKILAYVRNQISNCPLTLEETGYRLRPASEITKTAYGTEAEKINLLTTLLKACGITASPFAAYNLNATPESCGLQSINQLLIRAQAEGKTYWLNIHSNADASQKSVFLLGLTNGEKITPPSLQNKIRYDAHISLTAEQQANAEIKACFSQTYIPYFKVSADGFVSSLKEPEVTISPDGTTITGKRSWNLADQNNYIIFSLPETSKGITHLSYARYNSQRQNNLVISAPLEEEYNYTLELPRELQGCTPAINKKIENQAGQLSIIITPEGSTIKVHRSLKLRKNLITPKEYAAFRQLILEWNDPNGRQLLLTKIK